MKEDRRYSFELPSELIAQEPAHPRDHARLLVYKLSDGSITDTIFYELPKFLAPHTTLVLNNSKVVHCRWLFENGKTEVFVLEKSDPFTIRALVRPGSKFRKNSIYKLTSWLEAIVTDIDVDGTRTLRLNVPHNDPRLKAFEHIPLPPYIKQDDTLASEYQTLYAKPSGSLAAPTAGLHFTTALLEHIMQAHPVTELTLHVGLGTFAKLTKSNFKTNRLHDEQYEISQVAANQLNKAHHITAVGTTTLRTLESGISEQGKFLSQQSTTDIFIRPGYQFKAVASLITNFHLPSTSLLMLVAAFIADKQKLTEKESASELQRIYQHAINQEYRFYSFGDAMIIV